MYSLTAHGLQLRGEGLIVLCVASSGIASLLLPGGRTAHSRFKIPVENLHAESTCAVNKESPYAAMLRRADMVVWDEAGNQHRWAFEAVDRTFRDLHNSNRPFGGTTVVFGGDFQQILPVVVRGSREDIVQASLRRSSLWDHITVLHLRQNMRLEQCADRTTYAQWLLDVGHGRTHVHGDHSKLSIPDRMLRPDLDTLLSSVYAGLESEVPPPPEFFLNRIILSARNEDVEEVNNRLLDRMAGEVHVYHSADTVLLEAGADGDDMDLASRSNHSFPPEYLRSLSASGLPPGELRLKVGCPIILLRNLDPSQGLCNGTRLIVVRLSPRVIEARIIGGQFDGHVVFIPRITLNPTNSNGEFPFRLSRHQFPIRLAFAMSINKSQGQSVKYVGLDLRVPVFSHGQLYVALSRSTSPDYIHVLLPEDAHGVTDNIVYPEVLLD